MAHAAERDRSNRIRHGVGHSEQHLLVGGRSDRMEQTVGEPLTAIRWSRHHHTLRGTGRLSGQSHADQSQAPSDECRSCLLPCPSTSWHHFGGALARCPRCDWTGGLSTRIRQTTTPSVANSIKCVRWSSSRSLPRHPHGRLGNIIASPNPPRHSTPADCAAIRNQRVNAKTPSTTSAEAMAKKSPCGNIDPAA